MDVIKINFRDVAIHMGYSYLNPEYGKWEDSCGKIYSIEKMNKTYVKNCKQFIKKEVKRKFWTGRYGRVLYLPVFCTCDLLSGFVFV